MDPTMAEHSTDQRELAAWSSFSAVLFDLDGVITPTASVHRVAWAELFEAFDFTEEDYLRSVDGKPRYEGVEAFLATRGVTLPFGSPEDPPDANTVTGFGNRKNAVFNSILERDGVEAYPGTVALMDTLDELGVNKAVVSSSRNAHAVLKAAGLYDRFSVIVDGATTAEAGLAGKPAPDSFLHGAELLDADPALTVVVEDAEVGVAAGVAGGFGCVLGVDRGGNRAALTEAGAHLVVDDLAEVLEGL